MPDRPLFPTSIIGSMPRPDFVKDLIADDCPLSDDEYRRLAEQHIPFVAFRPRAQAKL